MLVLTIKWDERIIITLPNGDKIAVVNVGLGQHKGDVRFGVEADPKYIVDRECVHDEKVANGQLPLPKTSTSKETN